MICASCGATAREGSAFCGSCGRPIIGYSVAQGSMAVAGGGSIAAGMPMVSAARGAGIYAGFWLRFVAAIIDGIILGIPYGFLGAVMFLSAVPMIQALTQTPNPNPFALISVLLSRIIAFSFLYLLGIWLYQAGLESSQWQATLGKKALGLYVTDLEGNRVTFGKASGRFFAGRGLGFVPYLGGLYYLVDCIVAGFSEKKQALHDMIASCLVQRNA